MTYFPDDQEFEDVVISEVEETDGGYEIKRKDGWSFFVKKGKAVPKVGSIARFYGQGIGRPVRGLFIDGEEVYYYSAGAYEQKQKEDLYGKTALDMLERWDAGKTIWSIEIGGFGPGYEQCIQILMMEIIRDNISKPLPTDKEWRDWGESTIQRVDDKLGGTTGAQFGAAKRLAYQFLKFGPIKMMETADEKGLQNRKIQVSNYFPSL